MVEFFGSTVVRVGSQRLMRDQDRIYTEHIWKLYHYLLPSQNKMLCSAALTRTGGV